MKYNINMNHLESKSGIHKLERDGFSRETIMKTMHKEMRGATKLQKEQIVKNLFDRQE